MNSYGYDAFGECSAIVDANPSRFVGQYGVQADDDTGLYYMWNRWYDPKTGRFLSRDPIGYWEGTNLYRYSKNNPVNWIDPWGLCGQVPMNHTNPTASSLGYYGTYNIYQTAYYSGTNVTISLSGTIGGVGLDYPIAVYNSNVGLIFNFNNPTSTTFSATALGASVNFGFPYNDTSHENPRWLSMYYGAGRNTSITLAPRSNDINLGVSLGLSVSPIINIGHFDW